MKAGNATSFGKQAGLYAAARPVYPEDLFDWVANESPGADLAWDVGTGSGQAAAMLAQRFARVHATDIDHAQIAVAPAHPRITYADAPAHTSGLPDQSADAITVATALHWFDHARFWPEVARVGRPGALFAAWSYTFIVADDAVMDRLIGPVLSVIEPYWSEGNRLSWRGYPPNEVGFPFERIDVPDVACELDWTPTQIVGFLRSWSAHLRARDDGQDETLAAIEADARQALGGAPRRVRLPLVGLSGRVA